MMTFLDLCSGIGGFSLGLESAGMKCVGQVEIDPWCNRVLQKHWPNVPKWGDVKNVGLNELPRVDLVCGGYPCQPFSLTGKRKGEEDDRHLWSHVLRIVQEVRPTWCLFENVIEHITMGLDTVLDDLENQGYSCQALSIPACAVEAKHIRQRVWILAHSAGKLLQRREIGAEERSKECSKKQLSGFLLSGAEATVSFSRVYRTPHGFPYRVDRTRGLGNAVVPQVVETLGMSIMKAHFNES